MSVIKDQNNDRIKRDIVNIDDKRVSDFFNKRVNKQLPHIYNLVNYQDNNPQLVIERDKIEKQRIGRFFQVTSKDLVLDIGCGVGRWGDEIVPLLTDGRYVGVDYTFDYIKLAEERFSSDKTRFIQGSFQNIIDVLKLSNEYRFYSKILINGVFMYINDDDLSLCLNNANELLANDGVLYIKESVGISERLTLNKFFSEELGVDYSAIYRSIAEYSAIFAELIVNKRYSLIACGPTWSEVVDYSKETSNWFWILKKQG